jgi:hypothetical protein
MKDLICAASNQGDSGKGQGKRLRFFVGPLRNGGTPQNDNAEHFFHSLPESSTYKQSD